MEVCTRRRPSHALTQALQWLSGSRDPATQQRMSESPLGSLSLQFVFDRFAIFKRCSHRLLEGPATSWHSSCRKLARSQNNARCVVKVSVEV